MNLQNNTMLPCPCKTEKIGCANACPCHKPHMSGVCLCCIEGNLNIARMLTSIRYLHDELVRMQNGRFTEQEFQSFCHSLDDSDAKRFFDGCRQYHIKLFGKSPIKDGAE